MKLKVITVGGGIFSNFYLAVANIESKVTNIDSIESIYIEPKYDTCIGKKCKGFNPFDFVLEQNAENFTNEIKCNIMGINETLNNINSFNLQRLRTICSKIHIKEKIIKSINPMITENTLGIHVRLTDMFQYHPHYISTFGNTTELYINKVNQLIQPNDSIFVASDNINSLTKFKKRFNVISNNCRNLADEEFSKKYCEFQKENFDKEWFWHDSVLDMISLSKCGLLLYNVSALNSMSFFFSSIDYKNTYRLGH